MCEECGLAQLGTVVSPEVLYRQDYPYEASVTRSGHAHWDRFADTVVRRFGLSENDLVVDIGSNVGVLLDAFRRRGVRIQGVDPAANIVLIAERSGIDTICDFFNAGAVQRIVDEKGQAAIVTATNVFAHIDDLHLLVENVLHLLRNDGVFILEAPYFQHLVDSLEYDTIYHEHLSYLSVRPLVRFFDHFGIEIIDIEQVDIHGGSFRVYTARKGRHLASSAAGPRLNDESSKRLHAPETLDAFAGAVRRHRDELTWLLLQLKHDGRSLAAVSAPAKGMTLLNYCRFGAETLDFVTEKSRLKIGRFTPGMHIPVVADTVLIEKRPDYALLLAWNFAEEIISNLHEYAERGGRFIIPTPRPRIV
jgi:SAM-dependent methyltransferase